MATTTCLSLYTPIDLRVLRPFERKILFDCIHERERCQRTSHRRGGGPAFWWSDLSCSLKQEQGDTSPWVLSFVDIKTKLEYWPIILKQNFCFDVNEKWDSRWCVTLYLCFQLFPERFPSLMNLWCDLSPWYHPRAEWLWDEMEQKLLSHYFDL